MTTKTAVVACALAAAMAACSKDPPATSTNTNSAPVAVAKNPGAHDGTNNADNTGINDRDRHDTVTATDQGNSKDELAITAAVRKSLMDSSLSFDAKNAKVVTTGTKVTLRGPVKSAEEKASIETMAKSTQGVTLVDNQLEVKK